MRVAISLLFLSASLANAAKNDEINFDDLQRSGGELSKTVTIPKISSEANTYMRHYLDDDSARIEKLNALRGSGNDYSSDSSNSNSTTSLKSSSTSSKNFSCHVYCKSVNGPVTWIDVSAESRRGAADYIDSHGHEICKDSGYGNASNSRFKESQCKEK